eukprot:7375900-Lingulodinium_polyedra.AAC.1
MRLFARCVLDGPRACPGFAQGALGLEVPSMFRNEAGRAHLCGVVREARNLCAAMHEVLVVGGLVECSAG